MAAVALATAPVAYEPGPSFVDLASLPLDMSAVPSWLHDFGTSVHDDDGLSPAPMLEPRAAPVQTDPTLPRWLAEPRPGAQGEEVFADLPWDTDETVADPGSVSTGFISEDDLPEWLRAISADVAADATEPSVTTLVQNGTGGFPVPAVVQAWVIAHQMVSLAAGESLMAHLAIEEEHAASPELDESPAQPAMPAQAHALPVASPELASTTGARWWRSALLVAVIVAILMLLVILRAR